MNNKFKKMTNEELTKFSGGENTVGGGSSYEYRKDAKACAGYIWGMGGQLSTFGCGDSGVYSDEIDRYC